MILDFSTTMLEDNGGIFQNPEDKSISKGRILYPAKL